MRPMSLQARHTGAALLSAMLTVTLVATFAAAALWQQWRSVEVETAERARVQSSWILTGALDWSRLILREDGRAGGADHLAEPWAVPLNEARLSSFLAVDKNASETEREAFLSGQVIDLQGKLNVNNLLEGNSLSATALASFSRLFELLGLPKEQLLTLASSLLEAVRDPTPPAAGAAPNPNPTPASTGAATAAASAASAPAATGTPPTPVAAPVATALSPLMPERVEQLAWLGLPRETLTALMPYITLLPQRTAVNLNTASAEVIYASTPGLDMASAQRLVPRVSASISVRWPRPISNWAALKASSATPSTPSQPGFLKSPASCDWTKRWCRSVQCCSVMACRCARFGATEAW